MDKDFYNVSFQFDRRSQQFRTLLASTPTVFQRWASPPIRPPSARNPEASGYRCTGDGLGRTAARTSASWLGTFDWAPKSPTSGHAFNIAFNGSYTDTDPQSLLASQTPSSLSASRFVNGGAQLRHTNYFTNGVLTESQLSVTGSQSRNDP